MDASRKPECEDSIDAMVRNRRRALGGIDLDADHWGLALSGGGIRSATFCFGLLHALARRRTLLRFDLMSTVSGGGYIGAMLGRLLQRSANVAELRMIVSALGEGNSSWFAWWLRSNGRYLVPRGVKDQLYALVIYMRNFIGIHVELGVVGLMLGAWLAGFNILGWWGMHASIARWPEMLEPVRDLLAWLPTLWLLLPVLIYFAMVVVVAYWLVPLMARGISRGFGLLIVVVIMAMLVGFRIEWIGTSGAAGHYARETIWYCCVLIASSWLLAMPVALVLGRRQAQRDADQFFGPKPKASLARTVVDDLLVDRSELAQDEARHQATTALVWLVQAVLVVALLGVLDRAAWWLAFEFRAWVDIGLWLTAVAVGLRIMLPAVSKLQGGKLSVAALLQMGNLVGRLLTFCLFAWWVAVVHLAALGAVFDNSRTPDLWAAVAPTLTILVGTIGYAIATGFNVAFLNLSSLHGFFRSRLVRSYLGASNPSRFFGANAPPLGAASSLPPDPYSYPIRQVGTIMADDDLPITRYRPHFNGGPVHLINACLSETRAPDGGLFNRDRNGRLITIAPGGMLRVSQQGWRAMSHDKSSLTLGSWTAISGAALAPAIGRMTRGGISSLIMFAGARVGFWWDSTALIDAGTSSPHKRRMPAAKLVGVVRETLGVFAGPTARDWYLTDGGHFDNTGVYALLAERCKMIVLADCGADPDYRFGDLENLVRKARIDLRADIEFLRPIRPSATSRGAAADPGPPPAGDISESETLRLFGSLNDLASDTSPSRFALARVTYRDDEGPESIQRVRYGYLVVVKPNLFSGLPVDLVNFGAEHPAFPQQSTADQFFDEAQWESHFQLGKEMGSPLTKDLLLQLSLHAATWFVKDDGTPIDRPDGAPLINTVAGKAGREADTTAAEGRLPARLAVHTVAAASLSLGAAAAAGVGVWQIIDSVRKVRDDRIGEERQVLKELSELQAKLPTPKGAKAKPADAEAAASTLAATLNRLSATLCGADEAGWFTRSALAVDVLSSARYACQAYATGSMSCNWLLNSSDPFAVRGNASCLTSGSVLAEFRGVEPDCRPYWAWDYGRDAAPQCAHKEDPIADARRVERERRRGQFKVVALPAKDVSVKEQPAGQVCESITVLPMVYEPVAETSRIRTLLTDWHSIGARISDTEDLFAKADMDRRAPPIPVAATELRYHEGVPHKCVEQLVRLARDQEYSVGPIQQLEPLFVEAASPLAPVRAGVIEVRFARIEPASSQPESDVQPPSAGLFVVNVQSTPCVALLQNASDTGKSQSQSKRQKRKNVKSPSCVDPSRSAPPTGEPTPETPRLPTVAPLDATR